METVFVFDAHLGHRKVAIEERGFATVHDHDDALLHRLWRIARMGHTRFWWGGDTAFDGWRERIQVIRDIPGEHHLVLGNHDRAFPGNTQAQNYIRDFMEVFDSVQLAARLSWNGIGLLLSHFPYAGDHTEHDRWLQWRLPDLGKVLIHGHTHATQRISFSPNGTMQIHAGLDAWNLRPPTLFELMVEAGFALPPMEVL